MNSITLLPAPGPLQHTCSVPGSKSITNRALLCAALSDGRCALSNTLFSDDTQYMASALQETGILIESDQDDAAVVVTGRGKGPGAAAAPLFVGNAGTAMRFLTAALTLGKGEYTLDGIPRMRERPIKELVDALRGLGATIHYTHNEGFPPLLIRGNSLQGGTTSFSGAISSQFISAVMLAAPLAPESTRLAITSNPVSLPYLKMTRTIMHDFGVKITTDEDFRSISIPPGQKYRHRDYTVESDASSASYFFAAAAVRGGKVTVTNISTHSIQGDIGFLKALEAMGCQIEEKNNSITVKSNGKLTGIDIDMRDISDTALTLAVTALFATGPTRISGVANMRLKETDRIRALCTELSKLGARIVELEDGLIIHPLPDPALYRQTAIDTYDDHRMAMSFALAGLVLPGIEIRDPGCTEKTFPEFFDRFAPLSGGIQQ